MKTKKSSQIVTLLTLFIIAVTLTACNNQTDDAYEFFKTAELQYETEQQKESIITALNDILNLSLSKEEELRNKRYPNYTGEKEQWDLLTLLNRYFVPAEQNITLGDNFYTQIKRKEVYEQIDEILEVLLIQNCGSAYEIIVGNNIKFDVGNDDKGKEEKLVIFTLVITNLNDTLSTQVLYDNIFINAKLIINKATINLVELDNLHKKEILFTNEGVSFSWGTSVDYLKIEYGNVFTVQWKYLDSYSNISKVNLDEETIK
ncbi:MAG: hypothetical protein U9N51_10925 [Bacteroidota bacterium]|nr:hypothetical protein [Bacteroidota bacterium]